jgi:hypothetical protein
MDIIKNIISIVIITDTVITNRNKIYNVFKNVNDYISKCYCVVCIDRRKKGLCNIH